MPLAPETKTAIFEKIKSILKKQSPPMVISKDLDDNFELIGNIPVPYGSTKKIVPGMFFCSALVKKDIISIHFFPMYMHEDAFKPLVPTMIKTLKGKTCFNINKPEQVNEKELTALLAKGIKAWKEHGYLK